MQPEIRLKVVSFLLPRTAASFEAACLRHFCVQKKENIMINLKNYGYTETEPTPEGLIPGRIVEFRRNQYSVMTKYGELDAVLKGSFVHDAVVRADLPCVGDFVLLHYNENGASRISRLLPRHSKFSR